MIFWISKENKDGRLKNISFFQIYLFIYLSILGMTQRPIQACQVGFSNTHTTDKANTVKLETFSDYLVCEFCVKTWN